MTAAGWTIMIVSVAGVLLSMVYCVVRVLGLPAEEIDAHLKAPLDIDTRHSGTRS